MTIDTTWLTAHEAAAHATRARLLLSAGAAKVTERTVRSWVHRGHLTVGGRDGDGRQLFALGAVARAELATRPRALRVAGVSGTSVPL